jgi:hypothetical protein
MAMLHRIEMNVIHMPREVVLITNLVFPVAPLPDSALAFTLA